MKHRCKAEQFYLEIYDETDEEENKDAEPGEVTGSVLCKARCSACGEVYLERVPYLRFTEDDLDDDEQDD